MTFFLRIAISAVLVFFATSARADAPANARALTESGLRRFQLGEYSQAIDEFKQAYLIDPQPSLLFNIAQAHRLSHQCGEAKRFYLNYLHDAPAAPNRAAVETRVAEMQRCIDTQAPAAPTPPPVVTPPSVTPLPVAPVVQTEPPPPQPTHRRTFKIAGLVGLSVGVALIAGGIAMSAEAAHDSNLVAGLYSNPTGGAWSSDYHDIESKGHDANTASIALYTLGGAFAVTGAVLTTLGFMPRKHGHVDVALGPNGASAGWSCAF